MGVEVRPGEAGYPGFLNYKIMEEIIANIVSKIRASKTIHELKGLYSMARYVFREPVFEKFFEPEFTIKFNQMQKEG